MTAVALQFCQDCQLEKTDLLLAFCQGGSRVRGHSGKWTEHAMEAKKQLQFRHVCRLLQGTHITSGLIQNREPSRQYDINELVEHIAKEKAFNPPQRHSRTGQ